MEAELQNAQAHNHAHSNASAISITRAGFIVCGAFGALLTTLVSLEPFGRLVISAIIDYRPGVFRPLIGNMFAPSLCLGVCWCFVAYSDRMANALFPDGPVSELRFERAAYRVLLTGIGVFLLAISCPQLVEVAGILFVENENVASHVDGMPIRALDYFPVAGPLVVQVVIAFYLIAGAPHLVKWQIRRSN